MFRITDIANLQDLTITLQIQENAALWGATFLFAADIWYYVNAAGTFVIPGFNGYPPMANAVWNKLSFTIDALNKRYGLFTMNNVSAGLSAIPLNQAGGAADHYSIITLTVDGAVAVDGIVNFDDLKIMEVKE